MSVMTNVSQPPRRAAPPRIAGARRAGGEPPWRRGDRLLHEGNSSSRMPSEGQKGAPKAEPFWSQGQKHPAARCSTLPRAAVGSVLERYRCKLLLWAT